MKTLEIADQMTAVGPELAKLGDLPEISIVAMGAGSVDLVLKYSVEPWNRAAGVATWAEHFGVQIEIRLSYGGSGSLVASFELAGVPVQVEGDVNSAHAYELGMALGLPLSKDQTVTIYPATLREIIAARTGDEAATS